MAEKFDNDSGVVTEQKPKEKLQPKLKRPPMYRVLLHNDDYTTREFVVDVLVGVFHHSESKAMEIMLHVHYTGVGVAGVFTREVAETKIAIVEKLAEEREYPFRMTMEPDENSDD